MGALPVVSSRAGAAHYREEDDEGSVWFLAVDRASQVVERALIEPGAALKSTLEKSASLRTAEFVRAKSRSERLDDLRNKRRAKEALTAAETQELLDLLAEV
jgi:carboxylesterase type B